MRDSALVDGMLDGTQARVPLNNLNNLGYMSRRSSGRSGKNSLIMAAESGRNRDIEDQYVAFPSFSNAFDVKTSAYNEGLCLNCSDDE